MLEKEISFNISVSKADPKDFRIDILDEDFLQPYDYQSILQNNPNQKFAKFIMENVEKEMLRLKECGIIDGHEYGDYI